MKWGSVLCLNPNGIRLPSTFCCPTQAITYGNRNDQQYLTLENTLDTDRASVRKTKHKWFHLFRWFRQRFIFNLMKQTPAEKIATRILYLWDVNLWPLGSRYHHSFEVVIFREWFLSQWSSLISGVVEDSVHLVLECLSQWVTRCVLQLIIVCFLDNLEHVSLIIATENKVVSANIQGHFSYTSTYLFLF